MFDGKIIRDKLIGNDNERAVSPVIGVILMVAITVILAAVIAAFVMDIGDMSTSANAGVDFDESGDEVTVQIIDEGNTDNITVERNGSDSISPSGGGNWSVGNRTTVEASNITVYGEVDGDRQVVATWEE